MRNQIIMVESLNEIDHGHLICYPVCGTGEFSRRHQALDQLSIDSIELVGQKIINKTFKTNTGQQIATQLFVKSESNN